jgi:hypothetical protein
MKSSSHLQGNYPGARRRILSKSVKVAKRAGHYDLAATIVVGSSQPVLRQNGLEILGGPTNYRRHAGGSESRSFRHGGASHSDKVQGVFIAQHAG